MENKTDILKITPALFVVKNVGRSVTVRCQAKLGTVKSAPSWYIDGRLIGRDLVNSMSVRSWTSTNVVSELRIINAQLDHSGRYLCSAEKIDGTWAGKFLNLTLRGKHGSEFVKVQFACS